jgi:hypothetical protein
MSRRAEGRALPTATANAHKPAGNWAAGVSRALRKGGLRVRGGSDPSINQDLRVKAGEVGMCTVVADFDHPRVAEQMIQAAAEILTAAGYTTKRVDIDGTIEGDIIRRLVVTRPAPPAPKTTPGGNPAPTWKRRKNVLGEVTYEHRWFPGWVVTAADAGFVVTAPKRYTVPTEPFATLAAATTWIEANR